MGTIAIPRVLYTQKIVYRKPYSKPTPYLQHNQRDPSVCASCSGVLRATKMIRWHKRVRKLALPQCRPLCTLWWSCRPRRWSAGSRSGRTCRRRFRTRCPGSQAARRRGCAGSCTRSSSPTCGWCRYQLTERSTERLTLCTRRVKSLNHRVTVLRVKKLTSLNRIVTANHGFSYAQLPNGWGLHVQEHCTST